ncbi:hypothetical protein [Streptosporangium sp. 'caverna']|uniref:hypothetical protein n=1 Tax=Streptosporangium sp. 'caverna' TaxID=2202249 RepID=UPI000D7E50DE|nr:hypothetical protein [Streptosporangium sp. 'caverna']AWS45466.1 hypothetical protein DKM19_33205 [Streptosporangium sp. 'caverna']
MTDPVQAWNEATGHVGGTVIVLAGGKRDALNGVTHRTVAAPVERLRLGAGLPAIARRVDGAREPVGPGSAAA